MTGVAALTALWLNDKTDCMCMIDGGQLCAVRDTSVADITEEWM
jgi:hypothetical protein